MGDFSSLNIVFLPVWNRSRFAPRVRRCIGFLKPHSMRVSSKLCVATIMMFERAWKLRTNFLAMLWVVLCMNGKYLPTRLAM